jgi:hypothetical protein
VLTYSLRLILYYPVSALVTLFANILQNPQDARARSDLKLMSSVVSFLTMLERDIIEANSNIRRMLSVCAEFERIASVALDKAEREMRGRGKRKQAEREREKAMKDAGSGKVAMGLEEGKTLEQMQIETQAAYRRPVDTASLRAASATGSVTTGSPVSWHGSPAGAGPEFLSPSHPPRHLQSSPLSHNGQHANGGFFPPQRPQTNNLPQLATSQQLNFSQHKPMRRLTASHLPISICYPHSTPTNSNPRNVRTAHISILNSNSNNHTNHKFILPPLQPNLAPTAASAASAAIPTAISA